MNNYEKTLRSVNDSGKIKYALKIYCYLATGISAAVFLYMLYYFFDISIGYALRYLVCLGVPFVVVSLVRCFFDSKRPYEVYGFYETRPKEKSGHSFPSRHAFSIFAIGSLCLIVSPTLGIMLLALGVIMCVCRVLLGIHFIRDVVVGSVVGVISSLIGALILL